MKKIDIIIPTRKRWNKLVETLDSVPNRIKIDEENIRIRTIVVCDADKETADKLRKRKIADEVILVKEHKGSVYCRNLAYQKAEDAVLNATDDAIFQRDAIKNAVLALMRRFPDGDGVIQFRSTRGERIPKAVFLAGHKFLLRFPEKKMLYPGYFHFAAQDSLEIADRMSRLVCPQNAGILIVHKNEADETWLDGRKSKAKDFKLMRSKEAKAWRDSIARGS